MQYRLFQNSIVLIKVMKFCFLYWLQPEYLSTCADILERQISCYPFPMLRLYIHNLSIYLTLYSSTLFEYKVLLIELLEVFKHVYLPSTVSINSLSSLTILLYDILKPHNIHMDKKCKSLDHFQKFLVILNISSYWHWYLWVTKTFRTSINNIHLMNYYQ